MRSNVRPPPKVAVRDNYPPSYAQDPPNLSNWRQEGYPSEFAYAKALGLIEIPKNNPVGYSNRPPVEPPYRNEPQGSSYYSSPYRSDNNSYYNDVRTSQDSFEQDVMREVQSLQANFQDLQFSDRNRHPIPIQQGYEYNNGYGSPSQRDPLPQGYEYNNGYGNPIQRDPPYRDAYDQPQFNNRPPPTVFPQKLPQAPSFSIHEKDKEKAYKRKLQEDYRKDLDRQAEEKRKQKELEKKSLQNEVPVQKPAQTNANYGNRGQREPPYQDNRYQDNGYPPSNEPVRHYPPPAEVIRQNPNPSEQYMNRDPRFDSEDYPQYQSNQPQYNEQYLYEEQTNQRYDDRNIPRQSNQQGSSPNKAREKYQSDVYGDNIRSNNYVNPADSKWRPSGNYSTDNDKAKKQLMREQLDRQAEEDKRIRDAIKAKERDEELRLEAKIRAEVEREQEEKRKVEEAKRQQAQEKLEKDRRRQEEQYQEDMRRKGRQPPPPQQREVRRDDAEVSNDRSSYDNYDEYSNGDNYQSPPQKHTHQSPINNNSPNKAREKYQSDVYGDNIRSNNYVNPADSKWRPSGNYSTDNDKTKKQMMREQLDRQAEEDKRIRDAIKAKEKEEEMRLEAKIRAEVEREQEEKRKIEETKRQQAQDQMEKDRRLQEEKRLEILAKKGKGNTIVSPEKTSTQYKPPQQSKSPQLKPTSDDSIYDSSPPRPTRYSEDAETSIPKKTAQQSQNLSNRNVASYEKPSLSQNRFLDQPQSQSSRYLQTNPNQRMNPNQSNVMNRRVQEYRPDTGDRADEYLSRWQSQNNFDSFYQPSAQPMASSYEDRDVSFVGDSRFIDSSVASLHQVFSSAYRPNNGFSNSVTNGFSNSVSSQAREQYYAPPPLPQNYSYISSYASNPQIGFNRPPQPAVYMSNADLVEKSLDSKSLFYQVNEHPTLLQSSASFPASMMTQYSQPVPQPVQVDRTSKQMTETPTRQQQQLSTSTEVAYPSPLSKLLDDANNFIKREQQKNQSFDSHQSQSISGSLTSIQSHGLASIQPPLSPSPQKSENVIYSSPNNSSGMFNPHLHKKQAMLAESNDEWIGNDEIIVLHPSPPLSKLSSLQQQGLNSVSKTTLLNNINISTIHENLLENLISPSAESTPRLMRADSDGSLLHTTKLNHMKGLLIDNENISNRTSKDRRPSSAFVALGKSREVKFEMSPKNHSNLVTPKQNRPKTSSTRKSSVSSKTSYTDSAYSSVTEYSEGNSFSSYSSDYESESDSSASSRSSSSTRSSSLSSSSSSSDSSGSSSSSSEATFRKLSPLEMSVLSLETLMKKSQMNFGPQN